jgi:hypothetical protein
MSLEAEAPSSTLHKLKSSCWRAWFPSRGECDIAVCCGHRTEVFANACVNWFTLVLAALPQHGPAGPAIWSQTLVVTAWKGRSFWRNAGRLVFLAGLWNHLPRCRLLCWEGGPSEKNRADQAPLLAGLSLIPFILVGAYTVAVAVTEIRNWHRNGRRRLMSNAEHIYNIANDHAQTVQVCIDRLHKLGANEQLKRLTARLQKLAVRAAPGDDDKDTKAARRQRGGIKGTNSRYVDA